MAAEAENDRPCRECALCDEELFEMPADVHANVIAAWAAVQKAKPDKVGELMNATTGGPMLFHCPFTRYMSEEDENAGTEVTCGISAYCWTCLQRFLAEYSGQSKAGGVNKTTVKCGLCLQTVSHKVPGLHGWKPPSAAHDMAAGDMPGSEPRGLFYPADSQSFVGQPTKAERTTSDNAALAQTWARYNNLPAADRQQMEAVNAQAKRNRERLKSPTGSEDDAEDSDGAAAGGAGGDGGAGVPFSKICHCGGIGRLVIQCAKCTPGGSNSSDSGDDKEPSLYNFTGVNLHADGPIDLTVDGISPPASPTAAAAAAAAAAEAAAAAAAAAAREATAASACRGCNGRDGRGGDGRPWSHGRSGKDDFPGRTAISDQSCIARTRPRRSSQGPEVPETERL